MICALRKTGSLLWEIHHFHITVPCPILVLGPTWATKTVALRTSTLLPPVCSRSSHTAQAIPLTEAGRHPRSLLAQGAGAMARMSRMAEVKLSGRRGAMLAGGKQANIMQLDQCHLPGLWLCWHENEWIRCLLLRASHEWPWYLGMREWIVSCGVRPNSHQMSRPPK